MRRHLAIGALAGSIPLLLAAMAHAADQPWPKTTHVYKTVGDVKLELDAYRPQDDKVRPVVVWFHGGALIVGSRADVPQRLFAFCQANDWAFVSIDYRLVPEAKLADVMADVEDSLAWIRGPGKEKLQFDGERLAVTGGSAGGYLTMSAGWRIEPRPRVLVAYWGYGDVTADWYAAPSKYYRENRPLVSREDALAVVHHGVLTGAAGGSKEAKARQQYYFYVRQTGAWPKEVTGFDPVKQKQEFAPFCPLWHVTSDYPPIAMVHGTLDDDVPYSESANMAEALEKAQVEHELITVEGGGHGLSGVDPKVVEEAHAKSLQFLKQHLTK